MVKNIIFSFLIFVTFLVSCNSRQKNESNTLRQSPFTEKKEYDTSIYLGSVIGKNADLFLKRNQSLDTVFGLESITKSNHLVEIRLYTSPSFSDLSYCTTLFYDSVFKMSRIKHQYVYDSSASIKERSFNTAIAVETNPDSIFNRLVENGIFSLGHNSEEDSLEDMRSTKFDIKDYFKALDIPNVKELTKRGLKNGTIIGPISDGTTFILEYKVGDVYNTVYINNPKSYFRHNPDQQNYRRKYEITSLLLSGFGY